MEINASKCSIDFFKNLVKKHPGKYTSEEHGAFYSYDTETNMYICVDNTLGECYVENFHTLTGVLLYFNYTIIPVDEIYEIDILINESKKIKDCEV